MARFIKKPVEIEAIRFIGIEGGADGKFVEFSEQVLWMQAALEKGSQTQIPVGGAFVFGGKLSIYTLEGTHMADPGDWIIKGIAGELYPCKPHIFAATYEDAV